MGNNFIELVLNPGATAKIATVLYTHCGLKKPAGVGSIIVSKDIDTVKNTAVNKVNALTEYSVQQSHNYHLEWWKDYWLKSYIDIDEPTLQNYYYRSMYTLGCSMRATPSWAEQPNVTDGLNGIFQVCDTGFGQRTLNYNYEAPFYGVHSSNRSDILQPYYLDAFNTVSLFQNYTANAGYKGVQIYRTHIPIRGYCGILPRREVAPTKNVKGLSSDQRSNIALFTKALNWDWAYTRDVERLKELVYPVAKDVAEFFTDFVVKESDGKY